jgi:hypothetical protein
MEIFAFHPGRGRTNQNTVEPMARPQGSTSGWRSGTVGCSGRRCCFPWSVVSGQ